MECEVKKGEERDSSLQSLINFLEEQVKVATDQLLQTSFAACLKTCHHVVAAVRSIEEPEFDVVERLDKVRETATVIGIQALAEQGTWREVIPFVEQVYTHTAVCPANIMRMCLLLHAHVREYMVCHSLIDSWLEWDDHSHCPESGAIVATYITNVLTPLGAYNLIPQFVERCTVLSSEEKQVLLTHRTQPSPQTDKVGLCPVSEHSKPEDKTAPSTSGVKIISLYFNVARKVWRNLAKKGWCQQLRKASKLFFLISFVLLALLHVQTDVTANFTRAVELWRTAVGVLYSMWTRQLGKYW